MFENDISTLSKLVLPRLPESCEYLIIKRANVDTKCDHLKVNVDPLNTRTESNYFGCFDFHAFLNNNLFHGNL